MKSVCNSIFTCSVIVVPSVFSVLISVSMSTHSLALSSGCIQQLLVGAAFDNIQVEFVVQVIDISISSSSDGYDRCTVTISDGEHFTDCYLAPQLLRLVRNAVLKKFAIASIGKVICCHVSDAITSIINELSVLSDNTDVINVPIPIMMWRSRALFLHQLVVLLVTMLMKLQPIQSSCLCMTNLRRFLLMMILLGKRRNLLRVKIVIINPVIGPNTDPVSFVTSTMSMLVSLTSNFIS
jgi:hypothetical protein